MLTVLLPLMLTMGFAVIYQYRRYRTLKGDSSMVRERKDFYQLKKAVGEEPVPEPEVEVVAAADAPGADAGAAVEPAPQRKKKKAKRARSASGTEVEAEDSGVPQTVEVPAESAAADPPRTAREEVIFNPYGVIAFTMYRC
jgi:hypothetical protein